MEEMSTWPFVPRENPLSECYGTENVSLPLNFTSAAADSKLYGPLPDTIKNILTKESVTPNFHKYCLSTKVYSGFKVLSDFYSVLSTNVDQKGTEFVSSLEARKYPFYGVQFHPEKINYLHPPSTQINQSPTAVLAAQYFGNFLVDEARKNKHAFRSSAEESRFLLNSYQTSFTDFYEYYCFSDSDMPKFDP